VAADDGDAPGDDAVTLSLDKDTQLSAFLDSMVQLTGRAILYDPNGQRIRGQKLGVTLRIKMPRSRLFDAVRAILSWYELSLVPVGPTGYEVYLAVDSRSTNNFVKNKAQFIEAEQIPKYADRDGLYIASFFPLTNVENLTTLRTALSTMVTPAGIGRVMEIPGAGIIVMDFAPAVATMQRLLKKMDEPSPQGQALTTIELKHARAEDVADAVQELWVEIIATGPARSRRVVRWPSPPPRIVPYPARNAVIIRSTRAEAARMSELIAKLDQPRADAMIVAVISLAKANAIEVADMLEATLAGPVSMHPHMRIVADPKTGSVLVAAKKNEIAIVREIVAQLDQSPKK
jgi:type II secretory pathway component GspD/PulD (secretin)